MWLVPLLVLGAGCFLHRAAATPPEYPAQITSLTLVGQYSIPPLMRFPPDMGLPFGGISGLALGPNKDLYGISDAQLGGRIYRLRVEGIGGELRVTPVEMVTLGMTDGNNHPDQESLAILPNGDFIVSSEGTNDNARLPPQLTQYDRSGAFLRILPLRDRYVPDKTGPLRKGARDNAGFESVTITPDSKRLFTATEVALFQDGDPATFDAGSESRLLEYVAKGDRYQAAREFDYHVEKLDKPPFRPGFYINGVVDLLALDSSTLLALERGYVEDADNVRRNVNTIRIYKVSLQGATDISSLDSLKDHSGVVPATKTLLLDLAQLPSLPKDLVTTALDNFEGMTFGPRLPDGRATLLLVSDDNFRNIQRTWFLALAIQ
jgi:hypothetical protein